MADPSPDDPLPVSVPPQGIIFPMLALLSSILTAIMIIVPPQTRSIPMLVLFISFTTKNLLNAVNAILWNNNNIVAWWQGTGWCQLDIVLQFTLLQAMMGVPPAVLRQLSLILEPEKLTLAPSKTEKRVRLAIELFFCIMLPVIFIAVMFVTIGFQYKRIELIGCVPRSPNISSHLIGFACFPLTAILPGCFYGWRTAVRLIQYRRQFVLIFNSVHSHTSKSRFTRLLMVSMSVLIAGTISASITLALQISSTTEPSPLSVAVPDVAPESYLSDTFASIFGTDSIPLTSWLLVGAGFAFFGIMGTGSEMIIVYKSWLRKLRFGKPQKLSRLPGTL